VSGLGVLVHNTCSAQTPDVNVGKKTETHHIASDKSIVSGYTKEYEAIFNKAGMDLQDEANLMDLIDHSGGHTKVYRQYVLDTLNEAVTGKTGDTYKNALKNALQGLKNELLDNPRLPYKDGGL
jgi:hypothetical protein